MIRTPATLASTALYCAASCPTSVEIAPSVTNTMLNPAIKANEFSITFRRTDASCTFNSSTPTPEISDTYPGTSGNTQGERKDTRPAKKAAIGRGKFDIQRYCTCRWAIASCRTRPGLVCGSLARFGTDLGGRVGHQFTNQFSRNGRSQYCPLVLLLDLKALDRLLHVRVRALAAHRDFSGSKDFEECVHLLRQLFG